MKTKLLIAILVLLLSGCKTKQITNNHDTKSTDSTFVYRHDKVTPVLLPVDSAGIRARFECDSNYNVVLKELFDLKSKNIQSAFDWHEGLFNYRVQSGGNTVYIPGSDYYYTRTVKLKETQTITRTVYREKQLSALQRFLISCGKLWLLSILLTVVYFIVKYNLQKIKK